MDPSKNYISRKNKLLALVTQKSWNTEYRNYVRIVKKCLSIQKSNFKIIFEKKKFIYFRQKLEIDDTLDDFELLLPKDFDSISKLDDLTFLKHDYEQSIYESEGIDQNKLSEMVKEYLIMMVDYLKENHFNLTEESLEHKNVMKKLLHTMTFLNDETMFQIFNNFNTDSEKEIMTRFAKLHH